MLIFNLKRFHNESRISTILNRTSKITLYSHSMVAGGLELMSYTTRLMPLILLMISLDTLLRNS